MAQSIPSMPIPSGQFVRHMSFLLQKAANAPQWDQQIPASNPTMPLKNACKYATLETTLKV